VRPTGEGAIEVTVSADGCEDVAIIIDAHAVAAVATPPTPTPDRVEVEE
jgi:hypothetical protein